MNGRSSRRKIGCQLDLQVDGWHVVTVKNACKMEGSIRKFFRKLPCVFISFNFVYFDTRYTREKICRRGDEDVPLIQTFCKRLHVTLNQSTCYRGWSGFLLTAGESNEGKQNFAACSEQKSPLAERWYYPKWVWCQDMINCHPSEWIITLKVWNILE